MLLDEELVAAEAARGLGTTQALWRTPFPLQHISVFSLLAILKLRNGRTVNCVPCVLLALHSDVLPGRNTLAMLGRGEERYQH